MEGEAAKGAEEGIEEKILRAIRARVSDFKEQADSITLENVRRTLEKDLQMKAFALDAYKRFIKQRLEECFEVAEDASIPKSAVESAEICIQTQSQKLEEQLSGDAKQVKGKKDYMPGSPKSEAAETVKESTITHEAIEDIYVKSEIDLNEDIIKKAIKIRASYFRANSEKISLVGVRRLLEDDLKLEKNTLDAYKRIISKQLDELLQSHEDVETTSLGKNRPGKHMSPSSSMSGSADEEVDEQDRKFRKRSAPKAKNNGLLKKQKRSSELSNATGSVKTKKAEPVMERTSMEDIGNSSDEANFHSSEEESVKNKRAAPIQSYGKKVEHLKSVIKSCGMGVPPSVYKRVKQAPESKRESYLIKELEDILSKEGLSTNPSEKEIKAVKKKKERAKELEGIDLSNIVSSTRRRTTSSFVVPHPKPEAPSESDDDDDNDEEGEDNGDSDDGNNDSGVSSEESEDGEEESE